MKHEIPLTSRLANDASKPHRTTNYTIILQALNQLPNNEGIADAIAAFCSLDKVECSRRLTEMHRTGLVRDTGRKGITVKGCRAIIWRKAQEETIPLQPNLFNQTA
jgi:hypothetical protein